MKPLLIFLLLSTAAWGQDSTIKAELPDNYYFLDSDTARIYKLEWIPPVQQDTIPVSLLVRIQGRPWAFFHDGWEVRKVDTLPIMIVERLEFGKKMISPYPKVNYSHLLYLDSKKRPIRKEWVVYQTFKR